MHFVAILAGTEEQKTEKSEEKEKSNLSCHVGSGTYSIKACLVMKGTEFSGIRLPRVALGSALPE